MLDLIPSVARVGEGTTTAGNAGAVADGRLTCVIAAYNAERTLAQTIASILGQGIPCDVVIVDDGSSDATARVAEAFGPPVRCIRQRNAGPGIARNTGVFHAKTEWLCFLDSDDRWLPGQLEQWKRNQELHPGADVFYCGAQFVDDAGAGVGIQGGHEIRHTPFLDLLECNWVLTGGIFCRSTLFREIGGFSADHRHGEDWDLWL